MKIILNIPDKQVTAAIDDLSTYFTPFGIEVTELEIEQLLRIKPSLISGLTDRGFDTYEREEIVDCYLKYILGMSDDWPMNCDSDEYTQQFYEKLKSAKKI